MSMNRCISTLVKSIVMRQTSFRMARSNLHYLCNKSNVHTTPLLSCSQHSAFAASTRVCSCRLHKLSEGDEDLLTFLHEEIEYEKKVATKLPSVDDFKSELQGTIASFSRSVDGERIVVSFDVNDNVNVDDDIDEESLENDAETEAKMLSYPSFKVQIIKEKGRTLQFFCEYNHTEQDDNEDEVEEEQFEEPFRIENVMLLNAPDADDSSVYQAETDTMDPNLYNLLMNMLYERGVTNEFARSVLSYSTATEQHLYLDFLKKLQKFTSGK